MAKRTVKVNVFLLRIFKMSYIFCSLSNVTDFRNLDQGRWYCFNDTRVELVGPEEIAKSFGGSYGGWSTSNTNAYMLMYRKVREADFESIDSFVLNSFHSQSYSQLCQISRQDYVKYVPKLL